MEKKYTKGEWKGDWLNTIVDEQGNDIADVWTNEYDAQLISAAPDMLRALEAALDSLEYYDANEYTLGKVKQAIKKAIG